MPKPEITHYCAVCGRPLDDRWPYAACKECGQLPCRHGNKPGECDRCDIEGDLAFDSRRESGG
jgi:hypothetical protein